MLMPINASLLRSQKTKSFQSQILRQNRRLHLLFRPHSSFLCKKFTNLLYLLKFRSFLCRQLNGGDMFKLRDEKDGDILGIRRKRKKSSLMAKSYYASAYGCDFASKKIRLPSGRHSRASMANVLRSRFHICMQSGRLRSFRSSARHDAIFQKLGQKTPQTFYNRYAHTVTTNPSSPTLSSLQKHKKEAF